jgi:hypothetical protein
LTIARNSDVDLVDCSLRHSDMAHLAAFLYQGAGIRPFGLGNDGTERI